MADLTTTVTESVVLNGAVRGTTNTVTTTGINNVYERIVTCIIAQTTHLATFNNDNYGSAVQLDLQDVRYIRITNLDVTNTVNLSLQIDRHNNDSAADESATISLQAGHSFIMGTPHDAIAVSCEEATIDTSMHDLESILVDSADQAVKLEIFVAGA